MEGNIVVVNTPQGDQAFRITNPRKTKSRVIIKAWHVFYDSENYLIADSYVVNKNCNDALEHLNNATEPESPFTTSSNILRIDSYRCVRTSLYGAIQTVLERWGGHLVRDNFHVEIRNAVGTDNGVVVQNGKNLKDIACEENWDNVVTKLLPVGKDGILLNELDPTASIYLESEVQYDIPYTKTVSFQQDINESDYQTEQEYKQALITDLENQGEAYLEMNCIPQVNYTLKANLEKLTDVGDTIEVKDDRLGLDIMTNVISFEYDCVLERYTEVEFGNFKQTISGLVNTITTSVENYVSSTTSWSLSKSGNLVTLQDAEGGNISQVDLSEYVNDVLGVKGDEEVSYRVGDVNLTRENLGVNRVTNTDIENMISS